MASKSDARGGRGGCRRACAALPVLLAAAWGAGRADAAVLLLNPAGGTPVTGPVGGTAPYAVASDATWNNGNTTFPSPLLYSDGAAATGVAVATAGDVINTTTGNATLNFAAASGVTGNSGTNPTTTSVYDNAPGKDFYFTGGASTNDSIVGARVTGLPFGIYDVYVVASYTGTTTNNHPGGSSAARQLVWAFSGSGTSLAYAGAGNTLGGAAVSEVSENSVRTWSAGNTYALVTVTIDATNPDLFVAASGTDLTGPLTNNSDDRGFINSVQIVGVPEPTSAVTALAAAGLFLARRQRRRA